MKFTLNIITLFLRLYFCISVSSTFDIVACYDDKQCQHLEICTKNNTCANILKHEASNKVDLNRLKRSTFDEKKDNKEDITNETIIEVIEEVNGTTETDLLTNLTSTNATFSEVPKGNISLQAESVANQTVTILMTNDTSNETKNITSNVAIESSSKLHDDSNAIANSSATLHSSNSSESVTGAITVPTTTEATKKNATTKENELETEIVSTQSTAKNENRTYTSPNGNNTFSENYTSQSMENSTEITTDGTDTTEETNSDYEDLDLRSIIYDRMRNIGEVKSNRGWNEISFSKVKPFNEIAPRDASFNLNEIKPGNNNADNSQQHTVPVQTFTEGYIAAFFRPDTFKENYSQLLSGKDKVKHSPLRGRSKQVSTTAIDEIIAEINSRKKNCTFCRKKRSYSDTYNKRNVQRQILPTRRQHRKEWNSPCSDSGSKNNPSIWRRIFGKKKGTRNKSTTTAPWSSSAPVDFRRTTLAEDESESEED